MEVIYFLILLFVVLLLKGIYDERNNKKILMFQIREEWGKVPQEEYSESKFESISGYYNAHKVPDFDVDEITWNDLDMDEVFMLINNTGSSIGEEYLYSILHKPLFEDDVLKERKKLIAYFMTHQQEREQIQFMMKRFGKLSKISLYEYINSTNDLEIKHPYFHYFYGIAFFLALASFWISIPCGVFATFGVLAYNVIRYNQTKAKIEMYFNVFAYIVKIVNAVEEMADGTFGEIEDYMSELKKAVKKFRPFRRGAILVFGDGTVTDGITQVILDYIRMIFHIDIIKFNSMLMQLRANQEALNIIYDRAGQLDAMIAVASFREYMMEYCEPTLVQTRDTILEVDKIYHPLLSKPVKNSMSQHKSMLITGSNASGKSTFLKTLAINAILSQTIYTCMADKYKGSYFKILSSMALKDDLFSKESYYMVEIKSLKRILDQVKDDVPVLCFVDEVLRGTNTLERIAASAEILHSFSTHRVLCVAATHDIELTYILEKEFTNYHFQEEIVENDILFDYRLYRGRAVSKNAIKLLSIIGYDQKIIDAAMNRANIFTESGEWTVF